MLHGTQNRLKKNPSLFWMVGRLNTLNDVTKEKKSHFSVLPVLNGMHKPETQRKKTVPLPDGRVVEHPSTTYLATCEKVHLGPLT